MNIKDSYYIFLRETMLENMKSFKYFGVTITHDLRWNRHVSNICTEASMTLGFLKGSFSVCPQDVNEMEYKGLVHPVFEYASSVWYPSSTSVQNEESTESCSKVCYRRHLL